MAKSSKKFGVMLDAIKEPPKQYRIIVMKDGQPLFSKEYDRVEVKEDRGVTPVYRGQSNIPVEIVPSAKVRLRIDAMSITRPEGLHTMLEPDMSTLPIEDLGNILMSDPESQKLAERGGFPPPKTKKNAWRKFRSRKKTR